MSEQLERIQAELDAQIKNADKARQDKRDVPIQTYTVEGKPRKQVDILIDIGREHDLFHDNDSNAYARFRVDEHFECYPVNSYEYRELLAGRFFDVTEKGCNRNSLTDAVTTLSAWAKHRGAMRPVFPRVALAGGDIVIDTGAADWSAIRVTSNGWRLCSDSPVMFRRVGQMQALPTPASPDFGRLWDYLNVKDDDRILVAAFMLNALRPGKPYAPILLSGEQGTGKSTFTKVLKSLIDPSTSPLRAPPKDNRDLLVGALNSWLLCIDNLSFLPAKLSDSLCRLATGGAISERTLYSNLDETLVEVMRPAILNGIEELATRPDLAERGIHIELEPISNRRPESQFWRDFRADAPAILAGLLNGLAAALRDVDHVDIGELPRMADFALWAEAGLPALGFKRGEFMRAYGLNQQQGMKLGIESSPAGNALLRFMAERHKWTGTASDLLSCLSECADESTTRGPAWPKSEKGLYGVLSRLKPALRWAGIDVERTRTSKARLLTLCKAPNNPSQVSHPSQSDTYDTYDASIGSLHTAHARNIPDAVLPDDVEVF